MRFKNVPWTLVFVTLSLVVFTWLLPRIAASSVNASHDPDIALFNILVIRLFLAATIFILTSITITVWLMKSRRHGTKM